MYLWNDASTTFVLNPATVEAQVFPYPYDNHMTVLWQENKTTQL